MYKMASASTSSIDCTKQIRSNDVTIFLVGKCESDIKGAKLPSKKQVLQLFFYKTRIEKIPVKDSIKFTVNATLDFWRKASIPTMTEINCNKKLEKLYQRWQNLSKNRYRLYEKFRNEENNFCDEINNYIFDIAASNALEIIKVQEDKEFLMMQREKGRPGYITCLDDTLANEQKRKEKRLKEENRKRKCRDQSHAEEGNHQEPKEMDYSAMDVDFDVRQTKQSYGKINFIDDRMLASMDKCRISDSEAMQFTSATLAAVLNKLKEVHPNMKDIKVEDFVLNRTSLQKMRKEYRKRETEKIIN